MKSWRHHRSSSSSSSSSSRPFPLRAVVVTAVLTLAAVLVAVNFSAGEKKLDQRIERLYGLRDPQYQRDMNVLLGPPVLDGNRFTSLVNGDRIFPAMLGAIRGAQKTITFETYIYWSGDIGRAFAEALTERSRAGVKVHVLLDWVGSQKIDEKFLDQMREAGVEIEKYHEPSWYAWGDWARMNNRTHRKLLVVDGAVGFTGGVGIAPSWTGDGQDPQHWRDTHFRVEGPVVAQMQSVFIDNWTKTSGEVLHGAAYFPPLQRLVPAGQGLAQMFSSSPSGGSESMHLMYLMAITAAEGSIDLASAYFVPDDLTRQALVDARKRGVRVRIVMPGPVIDAETVRGASRAGWGPLLEAGVEIYEYQPTMYHCKVLVVDGLMVSVGSTNFDNRSFRLNDEANLNLYDEAFAAEQTAVFERDIGVSKRITLEQWRARPWSEKALEHAAALLSSQL
jgi:cardiolipin synthase